MRRLTAFGKFAGFLSIQLTSKTLSSIRKSTFSRRNQMFEVAYMLS